MNMKAVVIPLISLVLSILFVFPLQVAAETDEARLIEVMVRKWKPRPCNWPRSRRHC